MTDTIVRTLTAPDAAAAAAAAAPAVAAASREERARWLEAVADALDAAKAETWSRSPWPSHTCPRPG